VAQGWRQKATFCLFSAVSPLVALPAAPKGGVVDASPEKFSVESGAAFAVKALYSIISV
jgi:hypothetical protein